MTQEVQHQLKDSLFFYRDNQGQPYVSCTKLLRPLVSEETVQTSLKVIENLTINFHFGLFCFESGEIRFEIDKSPEHFVNFSILGTDCIDFCSEVNGAWIEKEVETDLDWIIEHTNKSFA